MRKYYQQKVCYAILYEIFKESKMARNRLKKNYVLKNCFSKDIKFLKNLVLRNEIVCDEIKTLKLNLYLVLIEHIAEYILNEKIQNMSSIELSILKEFDNYQKHKRSGFGRYCFVSDIDFLESDLFESKRQKEEFFEKLFEEVYVFYVELKQSFKTLNGNFYKNKSCLKVVR